MKRSEQRVNMSDITRNDKNGYGPSLKIDLQQKSAIFYVSHYQNCSLPDTTHKGNVYNEPPK